MTATAILARLAHAGVRVEWRGDRLALDAASPPPPALLDDLRQHKAEVIDFLTAEAACDAIDERAAILADMCDRLPEPGTPERQRMDAEQARMVAGLLASARAARRA